MDPRVGRFVTVDPWAGTTFDPPSLHRYLYAAGDPLDKVDPSGRINLPSMMTVVVTVTTLAGAAYGYHQGGLKGAVQGAAAGFVFGVALYEVAALVIGVGMSAAPVLAVWGQRGGPPTITLPKAAPVTVTLPRGPATTVTISPPVPASLRLMEATTRTGGLVARAQRVQPSALRLEAQRAVAAWQRAIARALQRRGGSPQNAPGGNPPADLDEAAANFRAYVAEINAQLTVRQQSLIDDFLDGDI
jgi:hypothetical protein